MCAGLEINVTDSINSTVLWLCTVQYPLVTAFLVRLACPLPRTIVRTLHRLAWRQPGHFPYFSPTTELLRTYPRTIHTYFVAKPL